MIQRIQSVYLLLIAGIMLAMPFFLPIHKPEESLFSFSLYVSPTVALLVALMAFITIFLYKKRKLQIRLGYWMSVFILLVCLSIACSYYAFENKMIFYLAMILSAVAFIFDCMAIAKIKKDEKLVKSLDRIR